MIASRSCLLGATLIALAMGACVDELGPADTNQFAAPPAVAAVSPVDAYHVDVTFNKLLDPINTESRNNYFLESLWPASPIALVGVTLKNDEKTIRISTGTSMAGINCKFTVISLADSHGNRIVEALEPRERPIPVVPRSGQSSTGTFALGSADSTMNFHTRACARAISTISSKAATWSGWSPSPPTISGTTPSTAIARRKSNSGR